MTTANPRVRTYAELTAALNERATTAKSAATKKATDGDTTSEKDPQDKGHVSIPVDPDAKPSKQNTPESKTNADDQTKVLNPESPAKTIAGEEKPASLTAKAAAITSGLKKLADSMKTSPAAPGGAAIMPKMPPNDKTNEGADGGKNKPVSGGAGPKNNPDPNAQKDAATNVAAAATAAASNGEPQLDPSFLIKLARMIISEEEGRQMAHKIAERLHGAEAAQDIIKVAVFMEEKAQELEALQDEGALAAQEMWANATPEEQEGILKLAHVHELTKASFGSDLEKMAYDAGAAAAADMGDQGQLGQEAPGGIDEAIMQALDEMVQSGELTPELAAQILQALQGAAGGGGGGPEGGAGPEGGGGGMPPEMMAAMGGGGGGGGGGPEPDVEKEASTQVASVLEAVKKLVPGVAKAA